MHIPSSLLIFCLLFFPFFSSFFPLSPLNFLSFRICRAWRRGFRLALLLGYRESAHRDGRSPGKPGFTLGPHFASLVKVCKQQVSARVNFVLTLEFHINFTQFGAKLYKLIYWGGLGSNLSKHFILLCVKPSRLEIYLRRQS